MADNMNDDNAILVDVEDDLSPNIIDKRNKPKLEAVPEEGPKLTFGSKCALTSEEQGQVLLNRIKAHEQSIAGKEVEKYELDLLGQDSTEVHAMILRSYSVVQALVNCYNELYGQKENA